MRTILSYKIILLTSLLAILGGCRKEILHEIGVRQIEEEKEPVEAGTTWTLVEKSPTDILCLQAYDNKLFIGGEFEGTGFDHLCSYYKGNFSKGLNGSIIGDGVFDMQIIQNRLWIGGNFSYLDIGRDYDNLVYLDKNSLGGLNFGEWLSTDIEGLMTYNGNLYVRGYINNNKANIKTKHIEKVVGTSIVGFEQGISEPINDFVFFKNKMYVAGDDEFEDDVFLFGFWENGKWNAFENIDRASILDRAYAVEVFNNKLVLIGDESFKRPTSIQMYDGNTVQNIQDISIGAGKTKVIGSSLYVFGRGITINGVSESNIIRFDGSQWTPVGSLSREITDVELYDNSLFAATSRGLYILE